MPNKPILILLDGLGDRACVQLDIQTPFSPIRPSRERIWPIDRRRPTSILQAGGPLCGRIVDSLPRFRYKHAVLHGPL